MAIILSCFGANTCPERRAGYHTNILPIAVLFQHQDDGTLHPIAFMSKAFSDVEQNYQIHDKEMLAIIQALEEWQHFLEGAEEKFEIHTDHKNLSYFHTAQNLNHHQAWCKWVNPPARVQEQSLLQREVGEK